MTVAETAVYLSERGYRCRVATVRALCRLERLKHYRVGVGRGRIEVPESEADAFLARAMRGRGEATRKAVQGSAKAVRPIPATARGGDDGAWRAKLDAELNA